MEIAGFRAIFVADRVKKLEAELHRSARLLVSGPSPARAESVAVPPFGMHLMATLRFPRLAGLAPEEGDITVSAAALGFDFRQPFRLGSMIYGGRLEL